MDNKINEYRKELLEDFSSKLNDFVGITQSPIEELFLLAFLSRCEQFVFDLACYDAFGYLKMATASMYGETIYIIPQEEIAEYRVDFLIVMVKNGTRFVVECDGHDFHEKTKEQAAKDKSRERKLLKMGYKVVRFSGSEIYQNPKKCANEFEDLIIEELKKK